MVGVGAHDDPRTNGLQLFRIGTIRAVVGASPYEVEVEFRVCVERTREQISTHTVGEDMILPQE